MYVHTYLRSYLRVSPNTLEPVLCTRMKHIVCCVFIHLGAQNILYICTYICHWLFAYNFLSALCSLLKMCLNAYSISHFAVLLFTRMH